MATILLLEETTASHGEFMQILHKKGHRVFEAETIDTFLAQMHQADIAIIDIDLLDGNGGQAIQQLRQAHPGVGMVLLTAHGSTDDKIKYLRWGADHYLTRPIHLPLLKATINAMVRRIGNTGSIGEYIEASGWRLDLQTRSLHAPGGHRMDLSAQEMILMHLLASNTGKLVHRRLISSAFGIDWLDHGEHRLDQLVSRLRKRWRAVSGADLPLQTKRGQGYIFPIEITIH